MLEPMLASLADAPLNDPQLVYEPKYDGIRAIAEVSRDGVRLWSRLGNEKTRQFPEVTAALAAWAKTLKEPVIVDGEIVALDEKGGPTGFQHLQGRIHVLDPTALLESAGEPPSPRRSSSSRGARASALSRSSKPARASDSPPGSSASAPSDARHSSSSPRPTVAYIVFDLLRDGTRDLRDRPLAERRAALERLLASKTTDVLRISRQVRGDGRALYDEALQRGWEGLIAKHAASLYRSGKRTPDWRKVKIQKEQEFVVGGWTEPRQTRQHFGALLLGVYDPPSLAALIPASYGEPAVAQSAKAGQRPATSDLTYVGHTGTGFDEKELARVMKLMKPLETNVSPFHPQPKTNERPHWIRPELVAQVRFTEWTGDGKLRHPVYLGLRDDKKPTEVRREEGVRPKAATSSKGSRGSRRSDDEGRPGSLIDQLQALEDARRDGVLMLPGGDTLPVSNLHKIFWPKPKLTKGDLFRYYARVAPVILPVVADRPLVMKRFPNGVDAKPFYQHRAPEVPPGVRTAEVKVSEQRLHIIGGSLKTLMYTTQLAAISQDPWFSRIQHPELADHVALDLDPSEGVPFSQVLDVARWIRDELASLGATGWPKTSGAGGLHVYVPLPPRTPYDAGLLFCQIVATVVSQKHPKSATIERSVAARGRRVYVDYLQNILGKTLASAYSARASAFAGVSTPLSWKEVDEGVAPEDFTIRTVPPRVERVGDLWAGLRKSKGVDLAGVARYVKRR